MFEVNTNMEKFQKIEEGGIQDLLTRDNKLEKISILFP